MGFLNEGSITLTGGQIRSITNFSWVNICQLRVLLVESDALRGLP